VFSEAQRQGDFLSMNGIRLYMLRKGINSNGEFETTEGSFFFKKKKIALPLQLRHSLLTQPHIPTNYAIFTRSETIKIR
jgi:hypothetical protein